MGSATATGGDKTWRIGVDVGGTFTDLVAVDSAGVIRAQKVASTPSDPGLGVLAAVTAAARSEGLTTAQFLSRVTHFAHGSTVATNTVLEGKGARVGLLTTSGFRDSLEIRRGYRENPWDHRTPYAPVLVPRYLRLPVRGRIDSGGQEREPLAVEDLAAAAATFRKEGVASVAVALFNSYVDARHEATAADAFARLMPGIPVTRSEKVAPIIGEYERTSTAVLNAYIAPRTVTYLKALAASLAELGLRVPLLLIQNNGGAVSVDEIAERPVSLLLSGPAAGVGALRYFAAAAASDDLISMEIGGTSCDVLLLQEGNVAFTDRLDIGGYACVAPSVEIHTVGAGGGTIAHVDNAGLLHVGPTGAGAVPGPACYGLGGDQATITDAQVVLGRVKPGAMAGGAVVIDPAKARDVIGRRVAEPLRLSVDAAAAGMIRLMDQKLLHAVQRLSSERGHDPRRFTLVAAGGAGPLHASSVGRALGCRRVYLPRLAGAFCALGMLNSDVRHDYVRVHFQVLDGTDWGVVAKLYGELEGEARATLAREHFATDAVSTVRAMDLRYVGQQWDITVAVGAILDGDTIRATFEAEHDRLFGHTQPGGLIEITKLRAAGIGRLPTLAHPRPVRTSGLPRPATHRRIWLDPSVGWSEVPVFDPGSLSPGHQIEGPAVIDEATTTVLIGVGDRLEIEAGGGYLVTLGSAGRG
jgi:N-methylhydantoinase A